MKENVLVTGGTGVVGRPLVEKLLLAGKRVAVLSRGKTNTNRSIPSGAVFLQGDVSAPCLGLQARDYATLLQTVTTVYHLAARTDFKGRDVADYRAVNIDGAKNVHVFAAQAAAHLHYVSTAFVCGRYSGVFKEQAYGSNPGFHNGYEESKFIAERLVREEAERQGTRVTIYRPAIILERQPESSSAKAFGPFVFLDAVFRMLISSDRETLSRNPVRIGGNRHSSLPFVFDDDVAEALLRISGTGDTADKTYHLVCRRPLPNVMLEEIFNNAFGRKVATMADPQEFRDIARSRIEKIIARKTAMYAPYLDLSVTFDRKQLDTVMGEKFCSEVGEEELLKAFTYFLARKGNGNDKEKRCNGNGAIERYFGEFLPAIIGRRLLPSLVSLSCTFWIKVDGEPSRSLVVKSGRLESIVPGRQGAFGYSAGPEIFLDVVSGRVSPQQGFFDGSISLEGSNMDALKTAVALEEFFQKRPYQPAE